MIGKSVLMGLAVAGYAAAETVQTYSQPSTFVNMPSNADPRTGFG